MITYVTRLLAYTRIPTAGNRSIYCATDDISSLGLGLVSSDQLSYLGSRVSTMEKCKLPSAFL